MDRIANLYKLGEHRRKFHNPLFNVLTDDFDNAFLEKNITDEFILKKFYEESRSRESVTNARLLELFNSPPKMISKVSEFVEKFSTDPGMTYLLIGKKGIGKTVFLKKYFAEMEVSRKYIRTDSDINVYLDLRSKKTNKLFLETVHHSLGVAIFDDIKRHNEKSSKYLKEPEYMRQLDPNYKNMDDNTLSLRVLDNKNEVIEALFTWAKRMKYGVTLIVDNIDDFPLYAVKAIIDKCVELKKEFSAKCIIALRDYWPPRKLEIDDSHICSCHLGKPDVYKIVKKRLMAIDTKNIKNKVEVNYGGKTIVLGAGGIVKTFDAITKELVENRTQLHENLYRLANYNTREHLKNIYYFFHSPYLYSHPLFMEELVDQIKIIDPEFKIGGPRKAMFFDFIETFMAIHSLCYDVEESQIINLFYHNWVHRGSRDYRNTLIFVRILNIVPQNFEPVETIYIVDQLKCIGYERKAVENAIGVMLKEGLLESADGVKLRDVNEISVSFKGLQYLKKVITEYVYLLMVSDAVPMPEEFRIGVRDKFGQEDIPFEKGSLVKKHAGVRKFVDFLKKEEEFEDRACPERFRPVLSRIIGETPMSEKIREDSERSMERMMTAGKKNVKSVSSVKIV
ncbi:MAG: hypothetical protein SWQ30_21525 [Thermodesulfobacteriota bacterium]|nr:hypothetical protein [Thermodesulfobacteriota bacterium]